MTLFTLVGLFTPIDAAFENLILQSSLHLPPAQNRNQPYVYSGSLIFPSFKYLNQFEMGIFFPFKKILVKGHLFTSGDRLYRESAASVSAGIHLNSRLNYTLKVTGYHTQIDRYGAASGWSIGFSTALKLNDEILLIVDYDNLLTDQSDSFSDDIPKRGILSIESHVMDNQKLVYRLENEIPHEVNHHLFWQSTLRPTFRILGGFTSNPKTINFSGQFEKGKMTISVGTMYHPILSSSIGIRLFYNL